MTTASNPHTGALDIDWQAERQADHAQAAPTAAYTGWR